MTLAGKKILVAEDEESLREVYKDNLESFGAIVVEAEDGEVAFDKFKNGNFDIVLSDMRMPKVTGAELLEKIRKSEKKRPIFIVVTGFSDISPSELYARGASAVIGKPCRLDSLVNVLTRLLDVPPHGWSRTTNRHDLKINILITLSDLNTAFEAEAVNISEGGFFVQTTRALPPPSEVISFSLNLPPANRQILGKGIVRWTREQIKSGEHRGFGFEFINLDADYLKFLEEYLNYV